MKTGHELFRHAERFFFFHSYFKIVIKRLNSSFITVAASSNPRFHAYKSPPPHPLLFWHYLAQHLIMKSTLNPWFFHRAVQITTNYDKSY